MAKEMSATTSITGNACNSRVRMKANTPWRP